MSGFSIDWLNLREAADHRARAPQLLERARAWLDAAGPDALIVDLGAGTGSTLRAMNFSSSSARWRLVDHDERLLGEARRRQGSDGAVETCAADLRDVPGLPLDGASVVSASALFDLVSPAFCDALLARLVGQRAAFYAALNYDGLMCWNPVHRLDAEVLAAFNKDQQRDKGFGPALGPQAAAYLEQALRQHNYAVFIANSPWMLDPRDAALVRELCCGCAAAVAGALDAAALDEWLRHRLEVAADGQCIVGHVDLWAQPVG